MTRIPSLSDAGFVPRELDRYTLYLFLGYLVPWLGPVM